MNSNNEYLKSIIGEVGIVEICERLGMRIDKKRNQSVCLCPFHNDHHPSLYLYKNSNQYHCFSCGEHGNIYSLIEKVKVCELYDAVKWIESEFPQVLQYKPKLIKINENNSLIISNPYELAYECYKDMDNDEKIKLDEFARNRVYEKSFIENSEIFYAKENKLINKFPTKNIEARYKLESKLLIKRVAVFDENVDNGYRDYFKERIIITLRDYYNNIVGFSGRAIADEKPKYLFTKNLPKSSFLYRLNNAKSNILKYESKGKYIDLYLVEGIFDALRLESLGLNAAAVMGSHLTDKQTAILEKFVDEMQVKKIPVLIHIFMDSDIPGLEGTFTTIKNILQSNIALKCFCDVVVISKDAGILNYYKDADELLKNIKDNESAVDAIKKNTISIFDFFFRYFAPDADITEEKESEEIYINMNSDEKKIVLLNNIKNIIPEKVWNAIINRYNIIYENNNSYAYDKIKKYLLYDEDSSYKSDVNNKDFLSSMQNAVELAKNSYKKEILSLDDYTWDRILMGADAFYEYFIDCLKHKIHLHIPLLSMNLPKNKTDNRKKLIYIHEQLIMQQYVLNELLQRDNNKQYEYNIPAVRFNPDENEAKITTGKGYYEFYKNSCDKVVSFAYQISTKAVNGDVISQNGMFRPFYECWKDYISFIQDGIKKLNSETLYRVKLDIKGFYDNISNVSIRSALSDSINSAIRYSQNRFKEIEWSNDENDIVEWIIDELFDYKYYNPTDGNITERDNALIGIPQGPNLSAYVANIILFNLDKRIMEYVNKINNECKNVENNTDTIVVRYARYVDDMIIISSNPKCISSIKEIVGSELYKLGLSLSDKTDEADSISKEDALEWTVSEKGGLAASSVFDFIDDDDVDAIIDNNYDWNKIDRRNALKILSNLMISADFDDQIMNSDEKFKDISKLFFKTEEVRFNDIIRFSKSLICNLIEKINVEKDYNIFNSYENAWNELIKVSPEDSLFKRKNIHTLAFLEAIIQLLNIEVTSSNTLYGENYIFKIQKMLIKNIIKYNLVDNLKELLDSDSKNILTINRSFLKLKIYSLVSLINRSQKNLEKNDFLEYIIGDDEKNEYILRWIYCNKKIINDKNIFKYKYYNHRSFGEQILNYFHYIIANIKIIDDQQGFKSIISEVWEKANNLIIKKKSNNILEYCIAIWCNSIEKNHEKKEIQYGINVEKIALKVLINFVPNELLAEIINGNKILRNCIFDNEINKYLPVFPGVKYPGILGVTANNKKLLVERIEFRNYDNEFLENYIEPHIGWVELNDNDNNFIKIKYTHSNDIVPLSDYLKIKENLSYNELAKTIADIYCKIYKKIQSIQIKNNAVCLLSKENIYVELGNEEIVFFCYSLKKENCNYVVAIQEGENSYKVQSINESGNEFWQAGFILQDALNLKSKLLISSENHDSNSETLTLLNYAFKRLTGKTININYKKRSTKSYESSIKRTINVIEEFSQNQEHRDRYILDSLILDSFINYRMKQVNYDYGNGDIDYHISLWASRCISANKFNLEQIIKQNDLTLKEEDVIYQSSMRRVVFISYLLGLKISGLCMVDKKFEGLELLSKGLMCLAIFMNIKMQVLEQVEVLDDNQKIAFIDRELPFDLFGYDDRTILITKENSKEKLKEIFNCVLSSQYNENIAYITPLGWILLLGYVLEIDDSSSYIRGKNVNRLEMRKKILKLKDMLFDYDNKNLSAKSESIQFPFEQLERFSNKWDKNNFENMYTILNFIDNSTNTEVHLTNSSFFSTTYKRNVVSIQLNGTRFEKIKWFVTCGIIPNHNFEVECDEQGGNKFTQSINSGRIIGISYIEDYLRKIVIGNNVTERNDILEKKILREEEITRKKEKNEFVNQDNNSLEYSKYNNNNKFQIKNDGIKSKNNKIKLIKSQKKDSENIKNYSYEISKDESKEVNCYNDDIIKNCIDKELFKLEELFKLCEDNWKSRNKLFPSQGDSNENLHFTNMDRIALFQFNIDDSSYEHPESEKCHFEETGYYSVVEFRRRKLLLPVLNACEKFGVEILVLPEYSVRPETVMWLAEKIKKYNFSIWAGTFKITPGYDFSKLSVNLENKKNFEESNYTCSAVLPIILNKVQSDKCFGDFSDFNEVQVLAQRFKKYPSIALDEVINVVPALQDTFKPVVKNMFKGKLFGDARDDVTELICAEMFLMASPGNLISFAKKSYDMYCKFGNVTRYDFFDYRKTVLKDITDFGDYISIYQTKNKYNRTPIVLVPACTTRTADYYVNGQANYLATGITTVLCNSAGNAAKGGSCFIGQNSWDDYKLRNKYEFKFNETDNCKMRNREDYIPKNTIYHGLQPGIYQQSCTDQNRGALGVKEQALLICDVNPSITFKGSPNPESIMDSLSLVAHLPIIEEDIFLDTCKECSRKCFNKSKNNYLDPSLKEKTEGIEILSIRKGYKSLKRLLDIIYEYENLKKINNSSFRTTADCNKPETIKDILSDLGYISNSEWLRKRGEIYLKQHKNNPSKWQSPALLDWLYVVVNYNEYFRDIEIIKEKKDNNISLNNFMDIDYEIQMPTFNNKKHT